MKNPCNLSQVALLTLGLFFSFSSFSNIIQDTVYINRGDMMAVDSSTIPYFAFNDSPVFDKENKRLFLSVGDTMSLTVFNTDSLEHGFDIRAYLNIDSLIAPLSSATLSFSFTNIGAQIYFDHSSSENFRYMGLGGMIVVTDPSSSAASFYWNMKDHQKSFNETLNAGNPVDWSNYYPEYFTINGNSNPHINTDTNARVIGSVGDTIHIYMVNTGEALHSIHFHGYHAEIIRSTKFPNHEGRSKDTFPVYSMEAVMIELVPDQVGEYPVHDHNLVAVSGANIYPNGMFLTMLIN